MNKKVIEVKGVKLNAGQPKVCVSIIDMTREEIIKSIKIALENKAAIIEWRADYYNDVNDVEKVLDLLDSINNICENVPVIFTLRTRSEGGVSGIEANEYVEFLKKLIETAHIDILDVQAFYITKKDAVELAYLMKEKGIVSLYSYHDFAKTPSTDEIISRMDILSAYGAEIVKIAVMPHEPADVATLILAQTAFIIKNSSSLVIAISMGNLGKVTRVAGEVFGNCITFCIIEAASAPGQMNINTVDSIQQSLKLKNNNIVLIGFMGTGKTYVSKALAKVTDLKLIDLDEEIVRRYGMSINEIFKKNGEDFFRNLESDVLEDALKQEGVIISCGGGIIKKQKNIAIMKNGGYVFHLQAKPATIYERIKNSNNRPLLNNNMNISYIEELMKARQSLYLQAADYSIDTDGLDGEQIANQILFYLDFK